MRVELDKSRKEPLYWQIIESIRRSILNGELEDGSVLPSERKLAEQLEVHRNTVIRAYNTLKDQQLINSIPSVGYVVSRGSMEEEYAPVSEGGILRRSGIPKKLNWARLIKDDYQDMKEEYDHIFARFYRGEGISFSAGMPPFAYTDDELGQAVTDILKENDMLPAYVAPYQGDLELRRQVQSYLRSKGIKASMSELQVLSETNQALDFIIASMTSPGDCVIIEEPCSPDVYRVIELSGCVPIAVPLDLDGMITDGLGDIIEKRNPRFIYVNSSYHDPTGEILSTERRRELLAISQKYGIPIVEEDAASELYYEDKAYPTIKSMDRYNNVIYIYSFSLSFIPGISLAIVAADRKLIHAMQYLVSIRVISISWITQKLLARFLRDGSYQRKLAKMVQHNRRNRDIMCVWLDKLADIGVEYRKPRGGVYIWVRLPEGLTGSEFMKLAAKKEVAVTPGEVFFPFGKGGRDYVRLNYSYESAEWLKAGMERLTAILREFHPHSKPPQRSVVHRT